MPIKVDNIRTSGWLDTSYLRLDCTNVPLTGALEIDTSSSTALTIGDVGTFDDVFIVETTYPIAYMYGYGGSNFPIFIGRYAEGSKGSETTVGDGDILFEFTGAGHDGTSFSGDSAWIDFKVDGAVTTGHVPAEMVFYTRETEAGGGGALPSGAFRANGTFEEYASHDADDYILFQTVSNVPEITTVGSCDLRLSSSGTSILVDNQLVTSHGSILADDNVLGVLTLGGTGGTYNENLTFDFESEGHETDGTVNVGSTTGVVSVDFGSIELAADTANFGDMSVGGEGLSLGGVGIVASFGTDPATITVGTYGTDSVNAFLGGYYASGGNAATIYWAANTWWDGSQWMTPDGNTDLTAIYLVQGGTHNWNTSATGGVGNKVLEISNVGQVTIHKNLKFRYGANAASRSWLMFKDSAEFGDYNFAQSTTKTGSTYSIKFRIRANGDIALPADSQKLSFGAANDASIYYDGADMIFDSQEVGTGDFYFKDGNVGIGTATPTAALQMGDDRLIAVDVNAGLTASTTQSQGQGALTAQVNEISTVANDDDTVTLPSAVTGIEIEIINNGANTLQIFPASGDDLGLGVNVAEELEANERVKFVAHDTTNWAKESTTEIIHAEIHDEDNTDAFVINDFPDFHSYHTNGLAAGDLADWAFDAGGAGTSHAIASIADGVDSGNDIEVTTADNHLLEDGDIVSQTGLTDANYVGIFVVKDIISVTQYEVAAPFNLTGTGTMDQAATLEADAVAAGVYSFAYYMSGTPVSPNETFDFQLYKEATAVTGSKIRRKFGAGGDFGSMAGGGVVAVANGDKISFALSNEDSAANLTVRNLTIVLIRL